jgi:hypothetical protein
MALVNCMLTALFLMEEDEEEKEDEGYWGFYVVCVEQGTI